MTMHPDRRTAAPSSDWYYGTADPHAYRPKNEEILFRLPDQKSFLKGVQMNRFISDIGRVAVLLVVNGTALYLMDPANMVIIQALMIGIFFVGGTHLTRRILFHRLDLQSIAKKAVDEQNLSAAVIFAAICAFLIAVMWLSVSILK